MKQIAILTLAVLLTALPAAASAASNSQSHEEPVLLAQDEGELDDSDELRGDHPYDVRDREPVAAEPQTQAKPMPDTSGAALAELTKGIRWLGHASFLIQDAKTGKNIYIDPFRLGEGLPPADIVPITHDHGDHLSPDDVAKIKKTSTTIVSIAAAREKMAKDTRLTIVKPGDTLTVQGIRIDVVPAYNISKEFHPKAKGYVGYVVHAGGRTIYHAGDTDFIPEMKNLKVDVALVPVGGTYTMGPEEAAEAVNAIKPGVAVPMHYGTIVGSKDDAVSFKAKAKVPVMILEPEAGPTESGGKP